MVIGIIGNERKEPSGYNSIAFQSASYAPGNYAGGIGGYACPACAVPNAATLRNTSLQSYFAGAFGNELYEYSRFKSLFRDAYGYQRITDMLERARDYTKRPGLNSIDGIVSGLSADSGYSQRHTRRLLNSSPELRLLKESLSVAYSGRSSSDAKPAMYGEMQNIERLRLYRNKIEDYKRNDSLHARLDVLVSGTMAGGAGAKGAGFETAGLNAARLLDEDLRQQLRNCPYEAQMYAVVDRAVASGKPMKEAFNAARQGYLALVAGKVYSTGGNERDIMRYMRKQNTSTTARVFFARAGLNLDDIKSNVEKRSNAESQAKPDSSATEMPAFIQEAGRQKAKALFRSWSDRQADKRGNTEDAVAKLRVVFTAEKSHPIEIRSSSD